MSWPKRECFKVLFFCKINSTLIQINAGKIIMRFHKFCSDAKNLVIKVENCRRVFSYEELVSLF